MNARSREAAPAHVQLYQTRCFLSFPSLSDLCHKERGHTLDIDKDTIQTPRRHGMWYCAGLVAATIKSNLRHPIEPFSYTFRAQPIAAGCETSGGEQTRHNLCRSAILKDVTGSVFREPASS